MGKSDEFDDREKRMTDPNHGLKEMLQELAPLVGAFINKPEKIEIKMKVSAAQFVDLSVLVKKWEEQQPNIQEIMTQIGRT